MALLHRSGATSRAEYRVVTARAVAAAVRHPVPARRIAARARAVNKPAGAVLIMPATPADPAAVVAGCALAPPAGRESAATVVAADDCATRGVRSGYRRWIHPQSTPASLQPPRPAAAHGCNPAKAAIR